MLLVKSSNDGVDVYGVGIRARLGYSCSFFCGLRLWGRKVFVGFLLSVRVFNFNTDFYRSSDEERRGGFKRSTGWDVFFFIV